MDIGIRWGIIRHVLSEVHTKRWIPWVAIVLDVTAGFLFRTLRARSDSFTVVITAAVATVSVVTQRLVMRPRDQASTDAPQTPDQQRSHGMDECNSTTCWVGATALASGEC